MLVTSFAAYLCLEEVPIYASSNRIFSASVTSAWILFQTAAEETNDSSPKGSIALIYLFT